MIHPFVPTGGRQTNADGNEVVPGVIVSHRIPDPKTTALRKIQDMTQETGPDRAQFHDDQQGRMSHGYGMPTTVPASALAPSAVHGTVGPQSIDTLRAQQGMSAHLFSSAL
jgi:hypothetical protein